ncbi:hypothetical protein BDR04DRAFT_1016545, partial [Suillus decipiens]
FMNLLPHDIVHIGKRYPTSKHLFQILKLPAIAEHTRKCRDRPSDVFDEAYCHTKWVRSDWRQVNIEKVEVTLQLNFIRHTDLRTLLLGAGDIKLVEVKLDDYEYFF